MKFKNFPLKLVWVLFGIVVGLSMLVALHHFHAAWGWYVGTVAIGGIFWILLSWMAKAYKASLQEEARALALAAEESERRKKAKAAEQGDTSQVPAKPAYHAMLAKRPRSRHRSGI